MNEPTLSELMARLQDYVDSHQNEYADEPTEGDVIEPFDVGYALGLLLSHYRDTFDADQNEALSEGLSVGYEQGQIKRVQ